MRQMTGLAARLLIAWLLILTIHLLFTHKYLSRVTEMVWLLDTAYAAFYSVLFLWLQRRPSWLDWKLWFPLMIVLLIGVQLVLFWKIPQHSLNVDRWSVITSFWDTALKGQYPYTAKSHMNNMPGPSPFYFLLAFPFYLTGEMGFLSIAGLLLFIACCAWYYRDKIGTRAVVVLAIASLPVQYEIITRSTIFFNAVSILAYMLICLKVSRWNLGRVIIAGLLGGLLLSTRSVMVLPLMFLYVYLLKYTMGWKYMWALGISVIVGFAMLFIPLYFWDPVLFMKYNPITLQKSFLPNGILALLLIAGAVWSFLVKDKAQLLFGSGVMLYAAVAGYFLYQWYRYDYGDVLFNSAADISYFVLSLPFLFLTLIPRPTETV